MRNRFFLLTVFVILSFFFTVIANVATDPIAVPPSRLAEIREWLSALSGWAATFAAIPTVYFLTKQIEKADRYHREAMSALAEEREDTRLHHREAMAAIAEERRDMRLLHNKNAHLQLSLSRNIAFAVQDAISRAQAEIQSVRRIVKSEDGSRRVFTESSLWFAYENLKRVAEKDVFRNFYEQVSPVHITPAEVRRMIDANLAYVQMLIKDWDSGREFTYNELNEFTNGSIDQAFRLPELCLEGFQIAAEDFIKSTDDVYADVQI